MVLRTDHTNAELANRLDDHADAITNVAAHELEMDIREAARRLKETEDPTPLIPRLVAELRRISVSSDIPALRQMLGDLPF